MLDDTARDAAGEAAPSDPELAGIALRFVYMAELALAARDESAAKRLIECAYAAFDGLFADDRSRQFNPD